MTGQRGIMLFLLSATSLCMGCSSSEENTLAIDFSADSATIIIRNIDQAGLLRLKNSAAPDSVLNNLISVLQTPSERDTSIMEALVPGTILTGDTEIVFKPDSPFVKGRDYLVITHMNIRFGDAEKIAKSKLSFTVKPLQKLLTR